MQHLGIIGLGTMGANLARNAARNGATVAVFNRTAEKTDAFIQTYGSEGTFVPCQTLGDLTHALPSPRVILVMVKADDAVDTVLEELLPHLSEGDIVIDGGNSHYRDTERRQAHLEPEGIHFLGMGVSGGEEGALNGPSLMPGGSREAYDTVQPLLQSMAADDGNGGKCVTYVGPGGAGHFVKMVHNGIEYALMQGIAEAYHLLQYIIGVEHDVLATLFTEWNGTHELHSFLIEITAKIFEMKDANEKDVLDTIVDSAAQKGTGRWTTEEALARSVMVPSITAAVEARTLSSLKADRVLASAKAGDLKVATPTLTTDQIRDALICSMICAYAQGFDLLRAANREAGWRLNLAEIARIWQGGCIIRSELLSDFAKALRDSAELRNLMLGDDIFSQFAARHTHWRESVSAGVLAGVPLPVMTASLAYFDGYFHEQLPQNLIQAQRDYFGAHGFERTDAPGVNHLHEQNMNSES